MDLPLWVERWFSQFLVKIRWLQLLFLKHIIPEFESFYLIKESILIYVQEVTWGNRSNKTKIFLSQKPLKEIEKYNARTRIINLVHAAYMGNPPKKWQQKNKREEIYHDLNHVQGPLMSYSPILAKKLLKRKKWIRKINLFCPLVSSCK